MKQTTNYFKLAMENAPKARQMRQLCLKKN